MKDAAFNYMEAVNELLSTCYDVGVDEECPGPNWIREAIAATTTMRKQLRDIEKVLEAVAEESFRDNA